MFMFTFQHFQNCFVKSVFKYNSNSNTQEVFYVLFYILKDKAKTMAKKNSKKTGPFTEIH